MMNAEGCSGETALEKTFSGSRSSFLLLPSVESSLPGQMIEKAVTDQFQGFLDDASFLNFFQPGFLPGYRLQTTLVTLTDDLRHHLEQGGSVLSLLLDRSAAFDTVSHNLLAHCLTDAGMQETAL